MENKKINLLILVTVLTASALAAIPPEQDIPAELHAYTKKLSECTYWQREDVWVSKARSDEIRESLRKLNCKSLRNDETAIRKKYPKSKAIAEKIIEAKKNLSITE